MSLHEIRELSVLDVHLKSFMCVSERADEKEGRGHTIEVSVFTRDSCEAKRTNMWFININRKH